MFSFVVLLQDDHILLLSLLLDPVTEDSVDTTRLSDITRECFGTVFPTALLQCSRCFVIQLGAFAATNCFPSGIFPQKTQMRLL